MAVVLPSEDGYFSSASLRRARSENKFVSRTSTLPSSPATNKIRDPYSSIAKAYSDSTSSSAPSSPRAVFQHPDSTDISFASTPASNVSVSSSDCDDAQINFHPGDHFVLPDYDHACYPPDPLEELEPPPSPKNGHSYTASPDNEDSRSTSRPLSPEVLERAEDDTAVRDQPTRHVDYLSHNWTEEEIWLSWRYIVSRGKDYANAVRLENASWRTWLKKKNNLRTVSPETLNWLKECDVTWLYGPLQTREHNPQPPRRDTVSVFPKSHAVLRFEADNPGVYLLHCHIEWHVEMGLTATIIESPDVLRNISIPEDHIDACRAGGVPFEGNAGGNLEDPLDTTGIEYDPSPEYTGAQWIAPVISRVRRSRIGKLI